MSYDLFFTQSDDAPALTPEAFTAFFAERAHYTVENSQACYDNHDTGVYFSFEYLTPSPDTEPPVEAEQLPSGHRPTSLSFNINVFRPSSFGLESALELQAVCDRLHLGVIDPQIGGHTGAAFSRDGYLNGWNTTNQFGVHAITTHSVGEQKPLTLPRAVIERVWRWNYVNPALSQQLGDDVFVPRVFYVLIDGVVRTASTWFEGIACALPPTDVVLCGRSRKRWFGKATNVTAIVPYEKLRPLLETHGEARTNPQPHVLLTYAKPPVAIAAFLNGLDYGEPAFEGVSPDQVLDRELFVHK